MNACFSNRNSSISLSFRYGVVMLGNGSHHLRMKSAALATALVAASALSFAAGASANPSGPDDAVAPVADDCCSQVMPEPLVGAVSALEAAPDVAPEALPESPEALPDAPEILPETPEVLPEALLQVPDQLSDAVTVVHVGPHHLLAPGRAPERGMQIKTILVERSVSENFPQINSMIGVRPDAKPWHPNGLAVDIMIPNPGSAEGIALGNAIRDYALHNVAAFGIQDVIWRGTYYTPAGPSGSGYGHYDHVHITTTGGGYPHGGEEYVAP